MTKFQLCLFWKWHHVPQLFFNFELNFRKTFPLSIVKLKEFFGKMYHFKNGCLKKYYFFLTSFDKNLISFSENISGKLRSRKSTRHRSIFSKIDASRQNQPAFLFSHKYILLGFLKLSTKPPIFFLSKWNNNIPLTSLHFNISLDFLCLFTIIFHMEACRTLNCLSEERPSC